MSHPVARRTPAPDLEITLLPQVEAWAGEQLLPPLRPQHWLLLAILVAARGRPVPTDVLIDRLWEEAPPTARPLVWGLVAEIRTSLASVGPAGRDLLSQNNGSYRLDLDPARVDMHRFGDRMRLAGQLAVAGDLTGAGREYQAATDEWGVFDPRLEVEPLPGLSGEWVTKTRTELRRQYREAVLGVLDAGVRLGHHQPVVHALSQLVDASPYDEQATGLFMLAQYGLGRRTEALETYTRTRRRLIDDLAVEPDTALRDLQQQILLGTDVADLIGRFGGIRIGSEKDDRTDGRAPRAADEPAGAADVLKSDQDDADVPATDTVRNVTTFGDVQGGPGPMALGSGAYIRLNGD